VGEALIDHVGVGLGFEPTAGLTRETSDFEASRPLCMAGVTIEAHSTSCAEGVYDLYLFPSMDVLPDGGYEISAAAFAMKPWSRGSVRLTSADPQAPLAIDHGFLSDPRDLEVVAEGVEAVRALVASSPIAGYAAREIRPGPGVDARDHARAAVRGFFHPVGTCAIGRVVDGEGRVLGVDALRIADASIMPTIPRANTNLTAIAVAERLAELMASG
jgi:choline dehydrogenase